MIFVRHADGTHCIDVFCLGVAHVPRLFLAVFGEMNPCIERVLLVLPAPFSSRWYLGELHPFRQSRNIRCAPLPRPPSPLFPLVCSIFPFSVCSRTPVLSRSAACAWSIMAPTAAAWSWW